MTNNRFLIMTKPRFFVFAITFFLLLPSISKSQINLEGQLGGSNVIGFNFNMGYGISFGEEKNNRITPEVGLGVLFTGLGYLGTGIEYQYKKFGVGATAAVTLDKSTRVFINDRIIYSYLSYCTNMNKGWYFKFKLGYTYFDFGLLWPGIIYGYRF